MKISGIFTRVKALLANRFASKQSPITVDSIKDQIPYYLSQEAKEHLVQALDDFRSIDYYINRYQDEALQGDGWNSFIVVDFKTGERKPVKGILLTNSCDVSPDNKREFPPTYTFAPIIKLSKYDALLMAKGFSRRQIDNKVNAIKEQRVTSVFFLPKGAGLDDEYIALLGDVHTIPQSAFESRPDRLKLFTLSQVGFYLFVLKLSVHFCRFHEEVDRFAV